MRRFVHLSLLVGLAALAQETNYAPARPMGELLTPDEEARVIAIGKHLRCPVCQGVSIADSPSSMARAQLDKVRELVKEGKSEQEIREFFVARYGEWALLEPTTNGLNGFLWVAPVVMLLVGAFLILGQVKKAPATQQAAAGAPPTEDAFLAQVKKDLES
jgi:cytochrome c-type biogenesis protein CcmH